MDCGDYVVVMNCKKVKVTGRKDQQFMYRKHSMYPGGLKETPYKDMMVKKPEEVSLVSSVPPSIPCTSSRDHTLNGLLTTALYL